MICTECSRLDIGPLYSEFKSQYIKLTVCPGCGKVADKYIEFDYVILFLDILLLKPQAYRHLAFNVVEGAMFRTEEDGFARYKPLLRYAALAVLFEVYLTWAYEERQKVGISKLVLGQTVVVQYGFFIVQQLVEKSVLCGVIVVGGDKWMRWRRKNLDVSEKLQSGYHVCVVLLTVLISQAVKCLPIIMLIWPYDTYALAMLAVDVLGFFNTVDALHSNFRGAYLRTAVLVLVASLLSIAVRKMAVCFLILAFSRTSFSELFQEEITFPEWVSVPWTRPVG